jgi:hypothetical protein
MRATAQQRVKQERSGGDDRKCGLHDTLKTKEQRKQERVTMIPLDQSYVKLETLASAANHAAIVPTIGQIRTFAE